MNESKVAARIQADMVTAMKSKDAETLSTLRMLKAALMEAKTRKAKEETLSEDEEIEVLQRYVKKRRETIDGLRQASRDDLIAKEEREIEVTNRYLPAALGEAEVRSIVSEAVASTGASSPKDMGKVMGAVMPRVKGRADGALISRLVKEALGG